MRRPFLAALAMIAAACSGGASSASMSATPAGAAVTTSATADPCATGACSVRVAVEAQVVPEYQRRQVNYKLYQGCPRNNGVSTAAGFRGLAAVATSVQTTLEVPSSFKGQYGTVVRFEGPTPQQYVVVDFGAASSAPANFGQLWTGSALQTDQVVTNTNQSFERRVCR